MSSPDLPAWEEMDGEILARRLDHVITAAEPLDALVTRITYDIRPVNTRHTFPATALQDRTPFGRVTVDMDVRAARIGQPCKLYRKGNGELWLKVDESLISDPCETVPPP